MYFKPVNIILCSLLIAVSCNFLREEPQESPVARVHKLYLYPSDVAGQMPVGLTGDDSIRVARRIIDEWIKDQLLLKKAEDFLKGSDYNIERQIEDYRASLLTFRFKQEVLLQRLDTIIPDKEILDYYTENPSNYLLNSDVARLTYLKIPNTAPQISMIRNLYRSDKNEDLAKLKEYCIEHTEEYIIQSQEWYRFAEFIQKIPVNIDNPGRYLRFNKYIESNDADYYYFVHIIEYIPEKQTAPVEMVAGDIRNVLINKRKITLLQELESSVYKEGLSRNLAEVYK